MSKALHDVIVVSLDVRIWSGRKKLRPEDLTASGRLPPQGLVSLGSKRLCSPDALQPFMHVRRRAEARCQAVGVRFAHAFAIPKAAAKAVLAELNDLAQQFRQARSAFLATYDEEIARWRAQYPDWKRLIAAELLPKAEVASRFTFGYEVFTINAVDADAELACLLEQGGAGNLCTGLVGTLYQEVASESCAFMRHSLSGRDEVTQRFLRPVRAIREKLSGLAFLDAGIAPLVGSIDEVLAAIPQKGRIDGTSLAALRGVVTLLTDPARMREHGRLLGEASDPVVLGAAPPGADGEGVAAALRERARQEERTAIPPAPTARPPRVSAFW
jgi:Protein of unknown function (DUF3150)